jgi:hypothetical protein
LRASLCAALVAVGAGRAAAQQVEVDVGAAALGIVTRAEPVPYDRALTEARLVRPVLMLHAAAFGGTLTLHSMLNLEGWTQPGGELSPGSWGEGFMDRRHPHTYFHEIMLLLTDPGALPAGLSWSLGAGKGSPPFGSDHPSARPALSYPVNHHWAHLQERALVLVSVSRGALTLEAARFNGDEPVTPSDWPRWRRFGDSWSARLTARPATGIELQGSRAIVKSPEHRFGAGSVHRKLSASARLERSWNRRHLMATLEWARVSELDGVFVYYSGVGDAQLTEGRHRAWLRFESTDRPEEIRLLDPFRSRRPHDDNSILGINNWAVLSAGYALRIGTASSRLRLEGVTEVSWARLSSVLGGEISSPRNIYGGSDIIALSLGLKLGAGARLPRMGRYGVLAAGDEASAAGHRHGRR